MTQHPECSETREEFSALLDGELSPERQEAVEAHLAQCADCLRELDGLKRVDTLYRELPNLQAPDGFEDHLRGAIRPRMLRFPGSPFRSRTLTAVLASAAALVLVVGVSFTVLRTATMPGSFDVADRLADKGDSMGARALEEATVQTESALAAAPMKQEPESRTSAIRPAAEDQASAGSVQILGRELDDEAMPITIPRGVSFQAPKVRGPEPSREGARQRVAKMKSPADSAAFADAAEPMSAPIEEGETLVGDERAAGRPMAVAKTPASPAPVPASKPARSGYDRQDLDGAASETAVRSVGFMAESKELDVVARAPAPSAAESAFLEGTEEREEGAYEKNEYYSGGAGFNNSSGGRARNRLQSVDAKDALEKRSRMSAQRAQTYRGKAGEPPRSFEMRDGVWYEASYSGEDLVELARDSKALRRLIDEDPGVEEFVGWNARVIFQAGAKWYALEAPEK